MEFNPVNNYFSHMMQKSLALFKPLYKGFHSYGSTVGIVLDRQDQFQTELFIVPEGVKLIEFHIHPNVDSIEIPLSGDFTFTTNGVSFDNTEFPDMLMDKSPAWVASNDIHGAVWRSPGAFLSFQYWKNGTPPTSVIQDYLLDENNDKHNNDLKGLPKEAYDKLKRLKKD